MKQIFFVMLIFLLNGKCFLTNAQPLQQKKQYTRQDSLRGTLNAERNWWDVDYYSIKITPDYKHRTIEGSTEITFKIVKPFRVMQIDLQEPMEINSVKWKNKNLIYKREGNVYHVYFPKIFKNGSIESIAIQFSGHPRVAVNPPWDGGWI
ncbi:MAG: M1 family peptidase, partial [Chitinophagaceae bacterium]